MIPSLSRLYGAIDGTWPCARAILAGPWLLREGGGGGQRVSCATAEGDWTPGDLAAAETTMGMLGQRALFMVRAGETALDAALQGAGYDLVDPVNLWIAPSASQTRHDMPRVTTFAVWPPLAIMHEIWAEAGIGPARLRIMERADGPKTGILGRLSDKPAGTAFCAIHDDIAMVHALEIRPDHRGRGLGKWMMRRAAEWAQTHGAGWMAVLCLADNAHANGLYASLGYECVGQYHYRIKTEAAS